MPSSIKRHLIIKQDAGDISVEYSKIRYEGYKTVLKLWSNTDDQIALTGIINALRLLVDNPVSIFVNNRKILKKLGKTGLFSYSEIPTGIFSSRLNFDISDNDFISKIFYNNEDSQVLHLASMKLIESRIQNGKEIFVETEVEPETPCCVIV